MPAVANLVHQLSTSTGTGNITLSAVNGRQSFNDAFGTGGTDLFDYFIMNQDAAEWERGTGHLSDATTLVRDTVLESTNSDAAVNFSAGTKDVTNDVPAALQVYLNSDGGIDLSTNDGVDINPGSDADADLITVGVTGAPTFSWDESADAFKTNKPVVISSDGNGDVTHTIAGASVTSDIEVHSEGATDLGGIAIHRHTDANNFGGHLLFLRSDGTHASPTLVDDGDTLGRIIGLGQDGTDYELAGEIRFVVDGTAAANQMPGAVDIYTNAGSQTLTRRVRFRADGSIDIVTGPLNLPNTGLHILDTDASHDLIVAPGSNLTADRTLTLTTGDADRTLTINTDVELAASAAQVRTGAASATILASHLTSANALVTLTDAATVAVDWTAGINFTLTLTTNRILGNPTNEIPGTWRTVFVISDGGPDTLTFGTEYGGTPPTLTDITTTQAYLLNIYCRATGQFLVFSADGSPA